MKSVIIPLNAFGRKEVMEKGQFPIVPAERVKEYVEMVESNKGSERGDFVCNR
ncbi:hypothetical protein [Peribacillus cavernae]|uniref:hypothetical protein n=1 Tax=Peribacillus cavernae TaxID=1674310 RepID=UPI00163C25B1|nr:hypothetical protein [Peribacillus cavernae]MDQ0219195.1 hypothetical protein [Peribacillus cavernae]